MLYSSKIETFEDLSGVMSATHLTRTLQVANYIGVFAALKDGPRPVSAVAEATETSVEQCEPLLVACCAMGLLAREGDVFANSALAMEYLAPGKPYYQGNMLNHGMETWKRWTDLPRRFRPDQGDTPWGTWDDFILAMHNLTAPGRGEALAQDVDLSGRRRLIDVGGGPGTYSVFLCKANPELHATIWDLPQTVDVARRVAPQFPDVADRLSFESGDWDADDFGQGYDCLLMSNVMHGATSDPEPKLAKAYGALDPGGLIIIQDFILNDERDGPASAALFNLYIGAFTFTEMIGLLKGAGFVDAQIVRAPEIDGCGVVTAVKP